VRNGVWIASDSLATAGISLITVLIMARLVAPSDFGIAALINGLTLVLNLYVEGFFHDALIQNRDVDDPTFGNALWFVEAIAALLIGIGLLTALLLSGATAQIAWLSTASLLSLPFSGYIGVANARERRELLYANVARASILGKVAGCLFGIFLARMGTGAWSLILQYTAGVAIQAVLLAAQTRWLPRPVFAIAPLRELLRFALPYAVMHTIAGVRLQIFTLLIAMFSNLSVAGYVNVAFRLTITPQTALTTTLMNFGFPLMAAEQHSDAALARQFELVTRIICISAVPAFVGLAVVAPQLVSIAFGANWDPVIVLIQIAAIGAAAGFVRLPGSMLARVKGQVHFSLYNSIFQLGFVVLAMIALHPQNQIIAVLIWTVPIIVSLPITSYVVAKISAVGPSWQLRLLAPSLVGSATMIAAVKLADHYLASPSLLALTTQIMVGAVAFIATVLTLDPWLRIQVTRASA